MIRYAEFADKAFWYGLDRHLPEAEFPEKIRRRQAYVMLEEGRPVGILRYNLFWDNTPFCTLIYIVNEAQRRGCGRRLMAHWEADMRSKGYDRVLTSTQADEDAQHFYRKIGYRDCGGMVMEQHEPMELFMIKNIGM